MNDQTWLSRTEAADHLRISLYALDSLARRGIITRHYAGGQGAPKYKRAELDKSMTRGKREEATSARA
jgi:hypothetical protein